jgi:dienelactone hydrolase
MTRLLAFLALSATALAQAPKPPADPDANAPASSPAQNRQPKDLPPPGVAIPDQDRAELTAEAAELGKEVAALKLAKLGGGMGELIPDVEIFHKAVDWALRYNEFYNVKEVATARALLKEGKARAAALRDGKAPWTTQTGPVARGYRSKIDGSVQPYGVVVPPTWKGAADEKPRSTWIWNHGRSENLTELSFIAGRMKSAGEFTPEDTFVVHPYGRYCNATKFAGEVDVFEALAATQRGYPVDARRLVNAGFSMGGASAWHLGAHYAGLWATSHAGAGFAETAEYAGVFSAGKTPPPWWEQILWRWYDATVCVGNFTNSPMLAYHGSEDKQGQSTTIMKRFAEKEGVKIEEFIGPGVGHKYEPKTKKDLVERIATELAKPRGSFALLTPNVHLVTYTPRYSSLHWLQVAGLERQWERAEVTGVLDLSTTGNATVSLGTRNVSELILDLSTWDGGSRGNPKPNVKLTVDKEAFTTFSGQWIILRKQAGKWVKTEVSGRRDALTEVEAKRSDKKPGVCGPIDDAFMDSFVFVKPTGAPLTQMLGDWTKRELDHAITQWRGIFRGDAQVVDDNKLTDAQIKASNIVLWGDPSSNAVFKKIADKLPVKWTAEGIEFGGKKYGPTHAPLLIFPNPLNPQKYVVLNSGFTFNRAAASGTNSQQTPKLPDWAIVDTSVPPDDKYPGKIVDAGFFDENWKFTTERPK